MRRTRGFTTLDVAVGFLGLAVLILGIFVLRNTRTMNVPLDTPYSAVLLNNGSVYFGKLESLGSAYPILKDVYYVQSSVNQETKAVTNVLVKRGKEWHAPNRMIINAGDIVFVEPVAADSKVAQLIAESKK
jgi:hypothetical protein